MTTGAVRMSERYATRFPAAAGRSSRGIRQNQEAVSSKGFSSLRTSDAATHLRRLGLRRRPGRDGVPTYLGLGRTVALRAVGFACRFLRILRQGNDQVVIRRPHMLAGRHHEKLVVFPRSIHQALDQGQISRDLLVGPAALGGFLLRTLFKRSSGSSPISINVIWR